MAKKIGKTVVNNFEGGWESRLRGSNHVAPSQGPGSYRYTADHPPPRVSPPQITSPPRSSSQQSVQRVSYQSPAKEQIDKEQTLEELRAEVAALRDQAQVLEEEGDGLSAAVHDMQDMFQEHQAKVKEYEGAINDANMRQQEAEEDLQVLGPKHTLMKQEHARVQTTIADLRLEAQKVAKDAMMCEDAEEELAMLLKNVVRGKHIDLIQHEATLDQEAKDLRPQLVAANRARAQARQDLAKLRNRVHTWTDVHSKEYKVTEEGLTSEQLKLQRMLMAGEDPDEKHETLEEQQDQAFHNSFKEQFTQNFG